MNTSKFHIADRVYIKGMSSWEFTVNRLHHNPDYSVSVEVVWMNKGKVKKTWLDQRVLEKVDA